jgi:hypothetical protein
MIFHSGREESELERFMREAMMEVEAAGKADVPHIVFAVRDAIVGSQQIVESVPYDRRHIRTYLGGC